MYNFSDNLNIINNNNIKIKAKLKLISTEDGGREIPITGLARFRPNHNFGNKNNRAFYIGEISFDKNDLILPGDERTVDISFLNVIGLNDKIKKDVTWRIQEGPKLIAIGTILEIYNN